MNTEAVNTSFQLLARIGYTARGVIYLIVGFLALLAAMGVGGGTTSSRGAIMEILNQPYGRVLLAIQVVGLMGYVVWRFTQSTLDADHHGTSIKGLTVRAGLMMSAVMHTFLAVWAAQLLLSMGGSGSSGSQGPAFLSTAFGRVVLGSAGAVIMGVGCAHIYKGWSARFERYMTIPRAQKTWARPLCRFGLAARGVVWLIIGWFLIDSVLKANSSRIAGMEEALNALQSSPYGAWLLGVVSLGLLAFGVYSLLEAGYRRVSV